MDDLLKQNYLAMFGDGLRKLRLDAGFSQEELAELAGIDRSYLGAIERGEHNLALFNIIKISLALNLQPYRLLEVFSTENEK
jgi:transcriptional regulator with XRE-family HTH domain